MSTRCEAVTKDATTRCRCKISRTCGAVYDGTGNTALILCDNHRKVLQRGDAVTDKRGFRWRAVFHGPNLGHYHVEVY